MVSVLISTLSSLFTASFVLLGTTAPFPKEIPKEAAKSQVLAVTEQGIADVDDRITSWTTSLRDPGLNLAIKECSEVAFAKIKTTAFNDVDEAIHLSIQKVDSTPHIFIGDLISILGEQQAAVSKIAFELGTSLEDAKQTCMKQYLSSSAPTEITDVFTKQPSLNFFNFLNSWIDEDI